MNLYVCVCVCSCTHTHTHTHHTNTHTHTHTHIHSLTHTPKHTGLDPAVGKGRARAALVHGARAWHFRLARHILGAVWGLFFSLIFFSKILSIVPPLLFSSWEPYMYVCMHTHTHTHTHTQGAVWDQFSKVLCTVPLLVNLVGQ